MPRLRPGHLSILHTKSRRKKRVGWAQKGKRENRPEKADFLLTTGLGSGILTERLTGRQEPSGSAAKAAEEAEKSS
jgi:hypothetical protein